MDNITIQWMAKTPDWQGWTSLDKELWHRKACAYLRMLAKEMGLKTGEYKVSSNKGGIAVLGDATLHTKYLYVHLGGSVRTSTFYYRGCTRGGFENQDYGTGFGPMESNQHLPLTALIDFKMLGKHLRSEHDKVRNWLS